MRRQHLVRTLSAACAISLVAAACGSDDTADEPAATEAETPEAEEEAPEEEVTEEEAPEEEAMEEEAPEEEAMEEEVMEEEGASNALAEPTTVGSTCAPAIASLPYWVAVEEGMFESRNLTSECVQIGNGPEQAAALVAGEAQFAGNIYNNVIPLIIGEFEVVAFQQVLDAQLFDIIVDVDFELPEATDWQATMEALDGTRVGVVARGAAAEDLVRELMTAAGLDPENLTYVAVGLDSITPMIGDEIDWSVTFDPNITAAEVTGVATRPFSIQQGEGPDGLNWPGLALTASREYVEENPDVVCAYSAAYDEAIAFIADPANRDRLIEISSAELPIDDPAIIEALVDNYSNLFNTSGEIDRDIITSIGELSVRVGKADRALTADDIVLEPAC